MARTEVIVRDRPHRWFVWRDVVLVLLTVTVLLLVRDSGAQDAHYRALQQQLAAKDGQIAARDAQIATAAARNKQLTDLLIARKIPVPPTPAPSPEPTLHPTATFTPRPSPTPSPRPAPSPTPPSPSPSCLVVANGTCITPPPHLGGPFIS